MLKILVVILVVAVIGGSYGMTFRHKRQSGDNEGGLDDRYGWDKPRVPPSWFPNQNQFPWENQNNGQFPRPNQNGGQTNQNGGQTNQNQQQPPPNTNTDGISSSVRQCITDCPVTSEYNPVCGSDSVTYTNPGRLGCAQACGLTVTLARSSPCPTTTVAPTK